MYYHNLYQNTCKTKPLRFSHSFLFLHTSAAQVRLKNSHELWVGKPSLQEVENWQLIYQYAVLSPKSSEMKSSKNILRILEREGRKQKSVVSSSLFFPVRSKSNKNTQDSLITGDKVLPFARCWDRNEGNGCAFLPTHETWTQPGAWTQQTPAHRHRELSLVVRELPQPGPQPWWHSHRLYGHAGTAGP